MADRSADWVDQALRDLEQAEQSMQAASWAAKQKHAQPDLLAVGVFGSYGRGTAGVGSDLDLLLILRHCSEPIWQRLRRWDTKDLPLASDFLVYGLSEWHTLVGFGVSSQNAQIGYCCMGTNKEVW
jgi:hypothetical protein